MSVQAHWEHGYRCHGYWCDKTGDRLGFVGLGPPGVWDKVYRERMDRWMHTRPTEEYKTLKTAKQAVENHAKTQNPSNAL